VDKELEGPVCKMTIPFSQLANAAVFTLALGLRCSLCGAIEGYVMIYVYHDVAEWPHEFPRYLRGTGILLEDIDPKEMDWLLRITNPTKWAKGIQ